MAIPQSHFLAFDLAPKILEYHSVSIFAVGHWFFTVTFVIVPLITTCPQHKFLWCRSVPMDLTPFVQMHDASNKVFNVSAFFQILFASRLSGTSGFPHNFFQFHRVCRLLVTDIEYKSWALCPSQQIFAPPSFAQTAFEFCRNLDR